MNEHDSRDVVLREVYSFIAAFARSVQRYAWVIFVSNAAMGLIAIVILLYLVWRLGVILEAIALLGGA